MEDWRIWTAVLAIVAFNIPIAIAALGMRKVKDFSQALHEKDPATGDATGSVSYSRVTGVVGAVIVGSLFWMISNIVIGMAILEPSQVPRILGSIGPIFLVGSALFLPYAFNQLKTLLQ